MEETARADVATRFSATRQPCTKQRVSTKFLHQRLSEPISSVPSAEDFRRVSKLKDDTSIRQALVDRLLQISFTDRVVVVGYDRETETPMERVSSMECIKAIEILKKYDIGLPPKPASRLEVANHLLGVAKLQVDMALGILGNRINEMDPTKLRQFFTECSDNPSKFLEKAQELLAEEEAAGTEPATLPASTPEPDKAAP